MASKYDKYIWKCLRYFSSHPEEKRYVLRIPPEETPKNFRKQFHRQARFLDWRTALDEYDLHVIRN